MPVPIRPYFDLKNDNENLNIFPNIDIGHLLDSIHPVSSLIKESLASDDEANLLLELWEKSSVIKNAASVEEKIYEIPSDFDKNSVLRLKSSGLITGGNENIKIFLFTSKGVSVIKTFVLGEQNNFTKNTIKKPYSIVLAEERSPKRKSALALASNLNLVIAQNVAIYEGDAIKTQPNRDQEFIFNQRLSKIEGTSRKEYNVRIYVSEDGEYEVWCFNGRLNGTQRTQPKGKYENLDTARSKAREIINSKKSKGYSSHSSTINSTLPGINVVGPATSGRSIDRLRREERREERERDNQRRKEEREGREEQREERGKTTKNETKKEEEKPKEFNIIDLMRDRGLTLDPFSIQKEIDKIK